MSIVISNLCKSYDDNLVLDNLNLTIKKGSLFGLLGPNGAGKTTLVSILNFLEKKDQGDITIFGFNHQKEKNKIKQISSYIPQTYAFYPTLSAYENLEFFGALYGLKDKKLKEKIDQCVQITSLEKFLHKKSEHYSGGVKRRLNIAIGLLNDPQILYLDEPTVGIDPQSRKHILDVIKDINRVKQTTIIYTSHYMEEIEYLCDDIAILDQNKIVLHEKKDTLLEQNSYIEITTDNEIIKLNHDNNYQSLREKLNELHSKNISIKDLQLPRGDLEKLFLDITHKDLRD